MPPNSKLRLQQYHKNAEQQALKLRIIIDGHPKTRLAAKKLINRRLHILNQNNRFAKAKRKIKKQSNRVTHQEKQTNGLSDIRGEPLRRGGKIAGCRARDAKVVV